MKRLIVCLDGTWNAPDNGAKPTNVVKILRAIRPSAGGIPQVVFYDKGVGTGDAIDRVRGGMFGTGLEENVQDGYRFLASNYEPYDEIYLFGFSRGAFTARSLAGFIGKFGLLSKARMHVLRDLWDHYRECEPERPPPPLPERVEQALTDGRQKKFLHEAVRIKCVGVWDTVGARGVPVETLRFLNRGKYEFHDVNLGPHIDVALHAVAIDEKRGPFAPTLWKAPRQPAPSAQVVEQVWFPGVHSNIGGSYEDARLSDLTLHWMIERVHATTGLEFDPGYIAQHVQGDWSENARQGTVYESRTALYTVSRAMPFLRLIGQNRPDTAWWRRYVKRMNESEDGQAYFNEMIHQSAIDRYHHSAAGYRPPNLVAALNAPRTPNVVTYGGDYPGNPHPPKP